MIPTLAEQRKIFIIEDQKLIVADLENTLQKLSYVVTGNASSAEEALAKLQAASPDLVLVDISLKGPMDGIDAAAVIRAQYNIPVVFLTAFGDEDTIARAKTTTPYGFIIKPFNERELRAIIEIAIYRHQIEKRNIGEMLHHRALEDFISLYNQAQTAINRREEAMAIAAHEIKNPLTTMQFMIETLATECEQFDDESGTLRGKFQQFTQQIERITTLVNNLFDTARITTGQLFLAAEEFDFAAMVRSLVEDFTPRAQQVGSTLVLEGPDALFLQGDRHRLAQVLSNLLANAIKYGAGGAIEIRVEAKAGIVLLRIKDFGIGMSKETIAKVFERFERGVSTRQEAGLGLGLYIASEIVTAHGGKLSVQSTLEVGSEFSVVLPRGGLG
jgi:signal transduction histidine kinase